MQTRSNLERRWNQLFRFQSYILLFLLPFSVCHPHNVPLRRVGTAGLHWSVVLLRSTVSCGARPSSSAMVRADGPNGGTRVGRERSPIQKTRKVIGPISPEPLGGSVTFSDWWVIAPIWLKPVFPQEELNNLVSTKWQRREILNRCLPDFRCEIFAIKTLHSISFDWKL